MINNCDGACKDNPGEAGSGVAVYYASEQLPLLYFGGYKNYGTNNIAELYAFKKALQIASEALQDNKIKIYSDSQYSIDCISKWAYSWKNNDWTKKGGEIKNLELIKYCHNLFEKLKNKIELFHVKGHSGIEGNELADRMAIQAINKKQVSFTRYDYNNIEYVLTLESY